MVAWHDMRARRDRVGMAGVVVIGALTWACSGSSVTRTPGPATSTTDDIGADVPVRVTSAAVKPSLLHLFNGLQATFVNEDTVPRTVAVDPVRSDQAGCSAVGAGPVSRVPGSTGAAGRSSGVVAASTRLVLS